jgi:hypothetical protein
MSDLSHSRHYTAALFIACGISLVVCYAVASQQLLLGDRSAGWLYPYVATFDVRPVGAALIGLAVSIALLSVLPTPNARTEWPLVGTWVIVGMATQALLRSVGPFSMTRVFLSDEANAFYRVTQVSDVLTVLSDFAAARATWPLHAQSNMPGKIILLFALEGLSTNPRVLTGLIVALSSAGALLMYVFVRNLFNDREVGLFSVVLYLFVPARVFFLPLMNTVTPTIFLVCACLVLRWLQTGRARHALASGAAVYAVVFFEPLPLVMGLLFIALIAGSLVHGRISWHGVSTGILAGLLAFLASHLAMRFLFAFDVFDALRNIATHAVEFNANEGRPYGYWLLGNLREFVFGAGICQTALFAVCLFHSRRATGVWKEESPIAAVTASLALILLITNLLGVNRGEVVRLWIFLACFVQIPAAYVCARLGRSALAVVVAATLLHTAIAMAMIGFVVL